MILGILPAFSGEYMPKGVYIRKEPSEKMKESHKKISEKNKGKIPYIMTDIIREKISKSLIGNIPINKGMQRKDILFKVDRYKQGLEIECKIHGLHKKWTLHSQNNVRCNLCAKDRQKISIDNDPIKFIYRYAKQRSKKVIKEFSISLEYLYTLINNQNNKCSLTGIKFTKEKKPSLDRIDSSKGYQEGNLQFTLIEVNAMKSNLELNKFIELCKIIYLNNLEAGKSKKK